MKSKEPLSRRMRRTMIVPLLMLTLVPAWATNVVAQAGARAAPPKAAMLVKATAAPLTLVAGGRAEALVTLEIAAGWHVNANRPRPTISSRPRSRCAGPPA